jgi:hypothetical protein
MAKPSKPKPATAWDWIGGWARSQGVDPQVVSLVEATEYLLTTLERHSERGLPLPPFSVRLAALLITIQSRLAVQRTDPMWEAAHSLIEQAYARDRALMLSSLREQRALPQPKPQILKPEPLSEPPTTLFDLVYTLQKILDKGHLSTST